MWHICAALQYSDILAILIAFSCPSSCRMHTQSTHRYYIPADTMRRRILASFEGNVLTCHLNPRNIAWIWSCPDVAPRVGDDCETSNSVVLRGHDFEYVINLVNKPQRRRSYHDFGFNCRPKTDMRIISVDSERKRLDEHASACGLIMVHMVRPSPPEKTGLHHIKSIPPRLWAIMLPDNWSCKT